MTDTAPVFLVDDQAPYTGVGVFARKLFEGLRPRFPQLRWLDLGYRKSSQPPPPGRERLPFLETATGLASVPGVRARNRRRLEESGLFRGARLHDCGVDYSVGVDAAHRVATVHDYYYRGVDPRSLRHPSYLLTDLYQDRLNLRLRRELSTYEAVVVPSTHVQRTLERRLGIPSTVVPQWVDVRRFHPRSSADARKTLGLPLERKVVLSVGAATWNKNLRTMERVARRLPPEVVLVKLGAPLFPARAGVLHRSEVPPDLYPLYFNAADVYLHTSRQEGFGLPLLEALASGVPVVSPPDSGASEILGELGRYPRTPFDLEGYLAGVGEALRAGAPSSFVTASTARAGRFSEGAGVSAYARIYDRVFA